MRKREHDQSQVLASMQKSFLIYLALKLQIKEDSKVNTSWQKESVMTFRTDVTHPPNSHFCPGKEVYEVYSRTLALFSRGPLL